MKHRDLYHRAQVNETILKRAKREGRARELFASKSDPWRRFK